MSNARLRRRTTVAVVLGVIMFLVAFFMHRSGREHEQDYAEFQRCVHQPNREFGSVCTLEQKGSNADSPSDYKDNYETQLLLGTVGMALGAVLVIGGVGVRIVRRNRTSNAMDAP